MLNKKWNLARMILVSFFLLVGCGKTDKPVDTTVSATSEEIPSNFHTEENGVKATVKTDGSQAKPVLTLKNESETELGTEPAYRLEKKEDGEWHNVNVEQAFMEPFIPLKPGETYEQEIEIKPLNNKGGTASADTKQKYRITKSIGPKTITVEFELPPGK